MNYEKTVKFPEFAGRILSLFWAPFCGCAAKTGLFGGSARAARGPLSAPLQSLAHGLVKVPGAFMHARLHKSKKKKPAHSSL
jgi:hypothetical protein